MSLKFATLLGKQAIREFTYLGWPQTCELEVETGGKIAPMTLSSTFEIAWLPKGTKIEVKG
jgi:hypothetical protein